MRWFVIPGGPNLVVVASGSPRIGGTKTQHVVCTEHCAGYCAMDELARPQSCSKDAAADPFVVVASECAIECVLKRLGLNSVGGYMEQ